MFEVGDKVMYDGKLCEVKRCSGSMMTSNGVMTKYDLWYYDGGFLYEAISEVEISKWGVTQ